MRKLTLALSCLVGMAALLYLDDLIGRSFQSRVNGQAVSYGLLLMTGFFTSFHCVGMCGAMVVSYAAKCAQQGNANQRSTHLLYAGGKTLSYTLIGGLFGAVGAAFTFTPFIRGMAGVLAGVFLLLFGLGLLKFFAPLNRFRIPTPAFLMRFIGVTARNHSHPFLIGMLNGLMVICGPLQAMYVMAAGTGSPAEGASMLFVFGVGTLPVMMGFGALAGTLSAQVVPKLVQASGFVVIALGVIMLNRGLAMSGSSTDFHSLVARTLQAVESHGNIKPTGYQIIHMKATGTGFEPSQFSLRKGLPVKWIIDGTELTYCNHRITVPSLAMEFDLKPGENIIEFTPQQTGVMPWSCWMGMLQGRFLVHDQPQASEPYPVPEPGLGIQWRALLEQQFKRWSGELANPGSD